MKILPYGIPQPLYNFIRDTAYSIIGLLHCESMKYDLMLHWITMQYVYGIPNENASRTELRNLCIYRVHCKKLQCNLQ